MFTIKQKGDFSKTEKFLKRTVTQDYLKVLEKYAQQGVKSLSESTPVDSGKTASSWTYEIKQDNSGFSIHWKNTNINNGINIALILQYGHGTRNGGYVVGRDYINPAIRPIFEAMSSEAWGEMTKR